MKNILTLIIFCSIAIISILNSQALVIATLEPSTTNVNANGSFTLTLRLSTTASEELTSIGYRLSVSPIGSGLFSITNRDISGSFFTDTTSSLAQIINTGDTSLPSGPDNLLNTENDRDLGATVTDVFVPTTGSGPFLVNVLTISTTATSGSFTISLFPGANVGFGDPLSPDSQLITANATFTVIPEPTTFALLGLGSLIVVGVRRRRTVHN